MLSLMKHYYSFGRVKQKFKLINEFLQLNLFSIKI